MKPLVLPLLLAALPCAAQDPAPSPCRPLFSTSAGLTAPGALELEIGAQRLLARDGCATSQVPTQFNLGLTSWLDLRVGWGGPVTFRDAGGEARHGGADVMLGAQTLVLGRTGFDLGLAYWHMHPRASVHKGLGTGRHDDTLLAVASLSRGRWALDVNVGANWLGRADGPGRVRQGVASCAVTCAPAPGWNLTLDTYALAGTESGPRQVSSILAASRALTEAVTVDLGVERGWTGSAPDWGLNVGLVWRIGRLWQAGGR